MIVKGGDWLAFSLRDYVERAVTYSRPSQIETGGGGADEGGRRRKKKRRRRRKKKKRSRRSRIKGTSEVT